MKKILFLAVMALAFVGCSSDSEDDYNLETAEQKEYIVSFGFTGEITSITEEPLNRAGSDDLYGIQVYSKAENGSEYKPYAYGLFDNTSGLSIKLLEGYKYKFESTMVVDGKNRMYSSSYGNNGYYYPFYINEATPVASNFVYSTSKSMSFLRNGSSYIYTQEDHTITSNIYHRPNVDRYYSVVDNYTPSENGIVNLNMKRVSFGLKVIADGLESGKLKIAMKAAPEIYITHPETNMQDIFTFENEYPYTNWTNDNYTEIIYFSVSWEKTDGAVVPLVSRDITFTRNKLTTVTVKVNDNSIDNGLNITNDSTPMGDGGSVVVESGEGIDTEVEP